MDARARAFAFISGSIHLLGYAYALERLAAERGTSEESMPCRRYFPRRERHAVPPRAQLRGQRCAAHRRDNRHGGHTVRGGARCRGEGVLRDRAILLRSSSRGANRPRAVRAASINPWSHTNHRTGGNKDHGDSARRITPERKPRGAASSRRPGRTKSSNAADEQPTQCAGRARSSRFRKASISSSPRRAPSIYLSADSARRRRAVRETSQWSAITIRVSKPEQTN